MSIKIGFLPCFSKYEENKYPIKNLYFNKTYVDKVKCLVSSLIDIENPIRLCKDCGIGKEVQTIRPDCQESKRLINEFAFPYQIYRIDYGNNPFRIIFGISNQDRRAYILAVDTTHKTYSGKQRR